MRQRTVLASVGALLAAATIAGGSAYAAAAPASAQAWLGTVCISLKSLEYDAAATAAAAPPATQAARAQLLSQLLRVSSEATALVTTAERPLPSVPQGASIAATLYRGGVAFRAKLTAAQALVRRTAIAQLSARAAGLTAQLRLQSVALGALFVGLGERFHSTELDAMLEQTPACQLVHG